MVTHLFKVIAKKKLYWPEISDFIEMTVKVTIQITKTFELNRIMPRTG